MQETAALSTNRIIRLSYRLEGETWILLFSDCDATVAEIIGFEAIMTKTCEELLKAQYQACDPPREPFANQLENAKFNRHVLQVRAIQHALKTHKLAGGSLRESGDGKNYAVVFTVSESKPPRVSKHVA